MDLLAAISSVDPPSLVAWLVFVFAAGMYPVGIMLGSSCSPCCGQSAPCSQCTEGELPDTITVTFDGLADRTPGPDLCALTFDSCYGSGASGRVTAPGGDPATDKGPVSAVAVTNGGSGYAKLGRVQPTVTASGGSGSGATITPTLTSSNDSCGIPYWSVTGLTISGGSGYASGDAVTFSAAEGDTEQQAATATITTSRTEPTLTASAQYGTGATFTVELAQNDGTPLTWGVASVIVTDGGSGYSNGSFLSFSGGTSSAGATVSVQTGTQAPDAPLAITTAGGTGAVLTPNWSGSYGSFSIGSVTVTNGGSGYADGDTVSLGYGDYYSYGTDFAATVSVDSTGAITSVAVSDGGSYSQDSGVIVAAYVISAGEYYEDNGIPTAVEITSGGVYYREDASAQPYVATVTVGVSQTLPSNGTGASLTATVESDTSSPDFGKIKSVAIDNGGSGYLAWEWKNALCCGHFWNGKSVVLKRNQTIIPVAGLNQCVYSHFMCGGDSVSNRPGAVALTYRGPSSVPVINIFTEWYPSEGIEFSSHKCDTYLTANKNVTDCSDWSDVTFAQSSGTATATVSVGGDYDATYLNPGGYACTSCCNGASAVPQEIAIEITGAGSVSGTYVRGILALLSHDGTVRWGNFFGGTELGITAAIIRWQDSCNDCTNACGISIDFFPSGVSGPDYQIAMADRVQCGAIPLCNPYGNYVLCPGGDCSSGNTIHATIGPA